MPPPKTILAVRSADPPHWVGDGFPVRTIFAAQAGDPSGVSPFLLLDHAGPQEFPPSDRPRGVDEHPHRGFETVTIVYQGEVEHRDSGGNKGRVGPGDVQWMTAASGVVHEEKHGKAFTERGGTLEMVQLWVNLPAAEKMSPPRYQELLDESIPVVELPDDAGVIRVIAGSMNDATGPARTVTPINLWDLRLAAGHATELTLPPATSTLVFLLHGSITLQGSAELVSGDLAVFDRDGEAVRVEAGENSIILVLNGEPIDEPVVAHGPFVMNTTDEIRKAIEDFQSGRMGRLDPAPS